MRLIFNWMSYRVACGKFSLPQVALILRDEDDLVKDRFIHNLKLSENYRSISRKIFDVVYIWNFL